MLEQAASDHVTLAILRISFWTIIYGEIKIENKLKVIEINIF